MNFTSTLVTDAQKITFNATQETTINVYQIFTTRDQTSTSFILINQIERNTFSQVSQSVNKSNQTLTKQSSILTKEISKT